MTNKTRVLYLLRFLKEQSDEGKAVTNSDIRQFFLSNGEKVTLPTIRDDIASLREAGYDISVREMNGVATYYKFLDREWTLPELQILIDAVSSGQFISAEKSRQIIQKLREMAGPTEREQLEPDILVSDHVKAPNEQIPCPMPAVISRRRSRGDCATGRVAVDSAGAAAAGQMGRLSGMKGLLCI